MQEHFPAQELELSLGTAFQRKKLAASGIRAPYPDLIELALATSLPSGERWVHEIKFGGYRVQVHLANNGVKVFTRHGNDWTTRFKTIADDAWHINAGSAIIDGEVVERSADGTTDFSVLQNELMSKSTRIVFVAFDLLYLNGYEAAAQDSKYAGTGMLVTGPASEKKSTQPANGYCKIITCSSDGKGAAWLARNIRRRNQPSE